MPHHTSPRVGLLTDSTAYLDPDAVKQWGIEVVDLDVMVAGVPHPESEFSGTDLAEALRRWAPVNTSSPSPGNVLAGIRRLVDAGAEEVVAVHLSGEMSGTVAGTRVAARSASVPVHVVDSRLLAMGLGFAVLAGARAAAEGLDGAAVVERVTTTAQGIEMYFCVDTLEHLRRGGRIGAAQALLGSALAVKPILHVEEGTVRPVERVRTMSRAVARLGELAAEAAQDGGIGEIDVAVQHVGNAERAEALARSLRERIPRVRQLSVNELGAVVGAHVGPGTIGVVVAPVVG